MQSVRLMWMVLLRSAVPLVVLLALGISGRAEEAPERSAKWKKAAGRTGEEWIPVVWSSDNASPFSMWSIHKTRYTREGDDFAGWVRSDAVPNDKLRNGKIYTHMQMRFYARCSKVQYRIGSTTYYSEDGGVIASDDGSPAYDWTEAGPDTFAEGMINFVCSSTEPSP